MALPEPPHDPDGPTAMVPGSKGQDGFLVSIKIIGDMTQNIFLLRISGPIDPAVLCPYGTVLPASGNPFSVVFQILTRDPPYLKILCKFKFHSILLATPSCASAGRAHCQLIYFIRFYPNYGSSSPDFLLLSQHIVNVVEYTPPNASHISHASKPSRVCFRYDIFSSHPQRAIITFKYS